MYTTEHAAMKILFHIIEPAHFFISSDVKECTVNPCHPNATCTEELGSFKCECKRGFTGDGMSCQGSYIIYVSHA